MTRKNRDGVILTAVSKAIQQHCPQVRIGSDTYSVVLQKPKSHSKNVAYFGMIDFDAETIFVDPKWAGTRVIDTLLHEILHGVIRDHLVRHVPKKDMERLEEIFVTQAATGLTDFILNNPGILKVWQTVVEKESK